MYDPDEECRTMIVTLKKLCQQKNMTPHAVAKEAGISTSTISYLLNGKTKPQVYTILVLCNVLGVTVSELFDSKDNGVFTGDIAGEEEKLIDCYRHLSDKKKEMLRIYVDMLLRYNGEFLVER